MLDCTLQIGQNLAGFHLLLVHCTKEKTSSILSDILEAQKLWSIKIKLVFYNMP